jgi:hypothetical protein
MAKKDKQWQRASHIEIMAERCVVFRDNYRAWLMHSGDPVEKEQVLEWLTSSFYRRQKREELLGLRKGMQKAPRPHWGDVADLEGALT